jgi:hypothetical protein
VANANQESGKWSKSGGKVETSMGNKTVTFAALQDGLVTIELVSDKALKYISPYDKLLQIFATNE